MQEIDFKIFLVSSIYWDFSTRKGDDPELYVHKVRPRSDHSVVGTLSFSFLGSVGPLSLCRSNIILNEIENFIQGILV